MVEDFSQNEQSLYDTVIALRKEVENLREAYSIVHKRINDMSNLADKTTGDAVKESKIAEELSKNALLAARISYTAAQLSSDTNFILATKKALSEMEHVYELAKTSKTINAARQTSGGHIKTN